MKKLFLGLCALFLSLNTVITSPTVSAVTSCHDTVTLFARGSGSARNTGENYNTFRSALSSAISSNFTNLDNVTYDLDYPAISVASPVALGALFNLDGKSSHYAESVNAGIAAVRDTITNTLRTCPDTKFILAGYSQGAQVVSTAIYQGAVPAENLIYAATFGDPVVYLPEGKHDALSLPPACYGKNLSNYRVHVPNCRTEHGLVGANNPYQTAAFVDKIGTWCNDQDIFCGAGINPINILGAHTAYKTDGSYIDAAKYIVSALAKSFPKKLHTTAPTVATPSPQDTVILIDSTGSMTDLIDRYRAEAKKLAQKTYALGGRVALYEYRDLWYNTAKKLCDFSCTPEEFNAKIDGITTKGGGDDPESALSASLQVMNELKWQKGANKSIVMLTDATYLSPDRDGTTLNAVITRSLEIDPVNFYIITPPSIQNSYAEWAAQTGGQVFSSTDDLSLPTTYITNRPVAILALENYLGAPGDEFVFDASNSYTENLDHYEWDLDLDGIFEYNSGANSVVHHTYTAITSGFLQVKVVDTSGRSSTMSARVTVTDSSATNLPAISNLHSATSGADAILSFTKDANTALVAIVVDGQVIGFTTDTEITLQNLPENQTLTVTLVPLNSLGQSGTSLSTVITRTASVPLKAPNAGLPPSAR